MTKRVQLHFVHIKWFANNYDKLTKLFSFLSEDAHLANVVAKTSDASNVTEDGTTVNGIMTLNRHPKPMTVSLTFLSFVLPINFINSLLML